MSFTKIRPGGFALNSKLLSGEMTALDTDHANAVDKSGDVLTGNVHVGTGAFVTVDTGGSVAWTGSSTATFVGTSTMGFATGTAVSFASGSTINYANGSLSAFAGGASITLASGTSAVVAGSYTFTGGGSINMNSGASTQFNVGSTASFLNAPAFSAGATFSGTTAVALGSPLSIVAGGSVTTAAGGSGIVLGNSDYVALSGGHPGRTVTRRIQLAACPFSVNTCTAAIAASATGVVCSTTTAGQINFFLPLLWNGATISTFTLYATPNGGHSAAPTMPTVMLLYSAGIAAGAAFPTTTQVGATGTFAYTTWNDSLVHAVTVSVAAVVSVNNIYTLQIAPESGANAVAGMAFHAVDINYTIADLRPQ